MLREKLAHKPEDNIHESVFFVATSILDVSQFVKML